jgi:hypothetical protein
MKKKHDYKNILLLISSGIIIYLLKNKQKKGEEVVLASNSYLLQNDGSVNKPLLEYKYKTCIYSNQSIKANLIKKGEPISTVNLKGIVPTDFIKISGIPLIY